MPLTVPAHQAALLPLKILWPSRVDGIALVMGSVAPDLAYAFMPALAFDAHGVFSTVYWSVPVAVLLSLVVRRFVLPTAGYLPDLGPLHLRDFAVSARVRHRLPVTALSALVGAASHVAWDLFTHAGGLARWMPVLLAPSPFGVPWFKALQYGSGALGTAVTIWCFLHIGRHRLLRRWHGEPRCSPAGEARTWWLLFAAIAALLAVPAVLLAGGSHPHILMARGIGGAILSAAAATLLTGVRGSGR
ncbi:DUF4184 family protein [Phytomonospora sp. NPDC050363]|uniref:DUF4184 family protein n=1 Tax=Phytomonospora sp. NPDC050363 TaxID=3155642 RepID=UPI003402E16B